MLIAGIGAQELLLIILAILILFGAKKIPELAQGLGKGIREFRKAMRETKEEIEKPEEETKPDQKKS
jgi:sec-independent protein translocase protein TatA